MVKGSLVTSEKYGRAVYLGSHKGYAEIRYEGITPTGETLWCLRLVDYADITPLIDASFTQGEEIANLPLDDVYGRTLTPS